MKLSAFDRWLTTDPGDRDYDTPWDESRVDEPPPCSTCHWVDAHEPGCPDSDPLTEETDDDPYF
jgi:hypothetical protein